MELDGEKIFGDNFNKCKSNLTRKHKQFDLREKQHLFFPILKAAHWVLVSIDVKFKKICFFDSLKGFIPSSTTEALVSGTDY